LFSSSFFIPIGLIVQLSERFHSKAQPIPHQLPGLPLLEPMTTEFSIEFASNPAAKVQQVRQVRSAIVVRSSVSKHLCLHKTGVLIRCTDEGMSNERPIAENGLQALDRANHIIKGRYDVQKNGGRNSDCMCIWIVPRRPRSGGRRPGGDIIR
jgi:hypothetical protein